MTPAIRNTSRTGPAARATAHAASSADEQQHELDAARDDDDGSTPAGVAPRACGAAARPRRLGRRAPAARPRPWANHRERPVAILFVGDVVGAPAGALLLALLPGLRRAARDRLRRRQRRERRQRRRHHAEDRRRAVRRRRRRDHARQPHLPPARDLRLPRRARADPAAGELPQKPARPRLVRRRARRRAARRREPVGQPLHARPGTRRSRTPTRRCTRCAARSTTCSSTCTPRRRARRSRWAGTSTAA